MPYPPAERLLSISFQRSREEHVDAMVGIGRRLMTDHRKVSPWMGFGAVIGLGALVGVAMEVHRRFVLPLLFGITETVPLGIAVLQFLPLLLILAGAFLFLFRRALRRQRAALVSHLKPGLVVDIEVFKTGVAASTGTFSIEVDWSFVDDIFIEKDRIEIACESLSIYIPERAFESRSTFAAAFKEIRDYWREANRRSRDSKMIAAGLD